MTRQSGQEVWNTKLHAPSPGARPGAVAWSPDGLLFALVFSDGRYTVHQVSNGRAPGGVRPDATLVASVAWARAAATPTPLAGFHGPSNAEHVAAVAAAGTQAGRLRISLYGALTIGELELNPQSSTPVYRVCVDENSREYAAVQDTWLYVYTMADADDTQPVCGSKRLRDVLAQLKNASRTEQSHNAAKQSARAVELGASLAQSCAKYGAALRDGQNYVDAFFHVFAEKDATPTGVLLSAALYGVVSPVGIEWIHAQHEQGFKRWYKGLAQSFDTLRRLLTDEILIALEELLMVVDDLRGLQAAGFAHVEKAHELVFDLIANTVQGSQRFELQACFMEYLFREEIDRPIAVTKLTKVALSEVVESLVGSGVLLGLPPVADSDRLTKLMGDIQTALNDAVEETCRDLLAQMQRRYAVDVGERVHALARQADGGYKLILESGAVVTVEATGAIASVDATTRRGAVFTGRGGEVLSLAPQDHALVLPDGSKQKVAFEPEAAATYYDGEIVTACVLSKDRQHYQFLTF